MKKKTALLLSATLVFTSTACAVTAEPRYLQKHKSRPESTHITYPVVETTILEPTETITETTIEPTPEPTPVTKQKINIWSYTDEFPNICNSYLDTHPDVSAEYEFVYTIIGADGYQPVLDSYLINDPDEIDIYVVELGFYEKYISGDMAMYAAPYKDFIPDFDEALSLAEIAPYICQEGTRAYDNNIVGLNYMNDSAVFAYRRSIAQEVFGTDDPAIIAESVVGSDSNNLDLFFESAKILAEHDYNIVSSFDSIYLPLRGIGSSIVDSEGYLNIDSHKEDYINAAEELVNMGATGLYTEWTLDWFNDFDDLGDGNKCFGYFAPHWLLNYILRGNASNTFGDWAICPSPISYFYGGTWVCANNNILNSDKEQVIGDLFYWIFLDTSPSGFQYSNFKESIDEEYKGTLPSSIAVLEQLVCPESLLGGQDIIPTFIHASRVTNSMNFYPGEIDVNFLFNSYIKSYLEGELTYDEAIDDFRTAAFDMYGIPSR